MSLVAKLPIAAVGMILLTGAGTESRPAQVLGNLTCNIGEAVETETKANRAQKILCVFDSLSTGTEELYEGTAYFADGTAGEPASGSTSWIVKGPSDATHDAGGLAQSYAMRGGAEGNIAEPALIGKDSDEIALHPVTAPGEQTRRREPPREPPPSISSSRQPPLRSFVSPGARRARQAMRAPSAGPRSRRPSCRNSRSRPLVQSRPFAPRP